jgi:hypothetical protein
MAAVRELSVSPSPYTDSVPAALFRNVLGHFPTGVTVITGRAGGTHDFGLGQIIEEGWIV